MSSTSTSASTAPGASSSGQPTSATSDTTVPAQVQVAQGQAQQHHLPPHHHHHPSAASPAIQPTLPSAETQRHVAEARRAVVATMENMLDSELQWRASTLHANAAVLTKQANDVQRATDGLRREREKLEREADLAVKRFKEIGNVQNWAEVIERDFLVLEETVRLANGGDDDDEDRSTSGGSCSCSECGNGDLSGDEADRMDLDGVKSNGKDAADPKKGAWSDANGSVLAPESSNGTDRAKDSGDINCILTGVGNTRSLRTPLTMYMTTYYHDLF